MTNLARLCCCGGCPADCCAFWACSPSGAINVTLSGVSETWSECDTGISTVHGEAAWTITATMTRIGTDCASYRYVATQCQLDLTCKRRLHLWEVGNNICDAPPADPCRDYLCDDCDCNDGYDVEVQDLEEFTYSGTLNGAGPADLAVGTWEAGVVPAGAVLTIACREGYCVGGCAEPVLVFTPASVCEEDPCGPNKACLTVDRTLTRGAYNLCVGLTDEADTVPWCLGPWSLVGKGCLSATSFDNARQGLYTMEPNPGQGAYWWANSCLTNYLGGASEWPLDFMWCEFSGVSCYPTGECTEIDMDWTSCAYNVYTPSDVLTQCFITDFTVPEGYSLLCELPPPACTVRTTRSITWNM